MLGFSHPLAHVRLRGSICFEGFIEIMMLQQFTGEITEAIHVLRSIFIIYDCLTLPFVVHVIAVFLTWSQRGIKSVMDVY